MSPMIFFDIYHEINLTHTRLYQLKKHFYVQNNDSASRSCKSKPATIRNLPAKCLYFPNTTNKIHDKKKLQRPGRIAKICSPVQNSFV